MRRGWRRRPSPSARGRTGLLRWRASGGRRWREAERHFQDALEMHARSAPPWHAWTQHQYADMLLRRASEGDREKALSLVTQALDTAQRLSMVTLVERALALKLCAQGVDPTNLGTSIDAVLRSVHDEAPDLRPHAPPAGTVTLMVSAT